MGVYLYTGYTTFCLFVQKRINKSKCSFERNDDFRKKRHNERTTKTRSRQRWKAPPLPYNLLLEALPRARYIIMANKDPRERTTSEIRPKCSRVRSNRIFLQNLWKICATTLGYQADRTNYRVYLSDLLILGIFCTIDDFYN